MTLEQSKMQKVMVVNGTFTDVKDLTELWFKIYPLKTLHIGGTAKNYTISFRGEWNAGLYVLGTVVDAVRQAKADCHLEVSADYE